MTNQEEIEDIDGEYDNLLQICKETEKHPNKYLNLFRVKKEPIIRKATDIEIDNLKNYVGDGIKKYKKHFPNIYPPKILKIEDINTTTFSSLQGVQTVYIFFNQRISNNKNNLRKLVYTLEDCIRFEPFPDYYRVPNLHKRIYWRGNVLIIHLDRIKETTIQKLDIAMNHIRKRITPFIQKSPCYLDWGFAKYCKTHGKGGIKSILK